MSATNHYQTLKIDKKATPKEIKQAYRRLVKEFHPDTQLNGSSSHTIIAINAAYEVLGDPQRRHRYDQQLLRTSPGYQRQQRTEVAQKQYQRQKNAEKEANIHLNSWLKDIYLPFNRLVSGILNPLNRQIDELAGDPFDDQLMADFQAYLEQCQDYLSQARQKFISQPNPAKMAKVAAGMYYCLNTIGDGIDELERFTLSYDEHSLHNGQELFRIAHQLRRETKEMVDCRF